MYSLLLLDKLFVTQNYNFTSLTLGSNANSTCPSPTTSLSAAGCVHRLLQKHLQCSQRDNIKGLIPWTPRSHLISQISIKHKDKQ